jgi:hypothetical protein
MSNNDDGGAAIEQAVERLNHQCRYDRGFSKLQQAGTDLRQSGNHRAMLDYIAVLDDQIRATVDFINGDKLPAWATTELSAMLAARQKEKQ